MFDLLRGQARHGWGVRWHGLLVCGSTDHDVDQLAEPLALIAFRAAAAVGPTEDSTADGRATLTAAMAAPEQNGNKTRIDG